MGVPSPPLSGGPKRLLDWAVGMLLTLIAVLMLGGGVMILEHDRQLATHAQQLAAIERVLERVEMKIDRLLSVRP